MEKAQPNSFFSHIEIAVGLHQRVEVIYVVDGFQARLINEKEETISESEVGGTVFSALKDLDYKLRVTRR